MTTWSISGGPTAYSSNGDGTGAVGWSWTITNGVANQTMIVIVGQSSLEQAIVTQGKSIVAAHLNDAAPPAQIAVFPPSRDGSWR